VIVPAGLGAINTFQQFPPAISVAREFMNVPPLNTIAAAALSNAHLRVCCCRFEATLVFEIAKRQLELFSSPGIFGVVVKGIGPAVLKNNSGF
jgi:hypothetical protein